jgi:hypothetical protein
VWVLVVTALGGCRGPAVPAMPSQGGPAWVELQSEHFTVWTDASPARGRALVRELEHLRQVVIGVGFDNAKDVGRSLVFALRDRREVNAYVPDQFVAYASSNGAIRQPLVVLPADADDGDLHVITHELTHVISFNLLPSQPRWFAEGLANFFASVSLDPDAAVAEVGMPMLHILATLKRLRPMRSAEMFACADLSCMDSRFYATAWAMFAYLANNRPQELIQYAERLRALPREAQAQAWAEAFPALTPDQLDHDILQWLAYGKATVRRFKVELRDWPITERALGDADVLAARATMLQQRAEPGSAPPPELASALALDPTHLLAQLVREAYGQPISADDARRITEAHPGDWRAWWIYGRAVKTGPEARRAWEQACALLADDPASWVREWCTPR